MAQRMLERHSTLSRPSALCDSLTDDCPQLQQPLRRT
jgi:hypothetical protein